MIFDSHAHYDDEAFDNDRDDVLKKAYESGVKYILNASSSIESSKRCVELAKKYSFIYAAVGVHPEDAASFNEESIGKLEELCSMEKVAAIGEIGLDYYYENGPEKDIQKDVFQRQIELAARKGLPIVVHDREAHGDTYEIISKYKNDVRGVLHCYSGSVELAREYVNMGFYIGFTGVITFKNARKSLEVLENVPLNRVLIETDCPYLAPVPFRGKRNDSGFLQYTARKASETLGMEYTEFCEKTAENARILFEI